MRLAIFGGTFDPIHNAHLVLAGRALSRFHLDRVLFIPAAHPPHKRGVTYAPYDDRVRMVELASDGEPRYEVSRLEAGTVRSYSVNTIAKVRARIDASDELFFIIGADAFAEIRNWHRWREVVEEVCFIVVSRPGHLYEVPPGARVERLDTVELSVSSSEVRRALAAGQRPSQVPGAVLEYIFAHGLYGARVPA